MTTQVKICGLKERAPLEAALEAGADYIGLVFYPRSPRHVGVEQARELARACEGRAQSVALFVDPTDQELDAVMAAVSPSLIQLHGSESPERVEFLRVRAGVPVIKACAIKEAEDVQAAELYRTTADLLLYDAKPRENRSREARPGGNGQAFDWQLLVKNCSSHHFMLSGGLNPDNVRAAIELTKAQAVDVSSGVETSPGKKEASLICRFIAEAKGAWKKE